MRKIDAYPSVLANNNSCMYVRAASEQQHLIVSAGVEILTT